MAARRARLGWAMEMLGDAIEAIGNFVRKTGAPLVAALWAFAAFLVAAYLIRRRRDEFGWKLGASLLAFAGAAGVLLWWSQQRAAEYYRYVDEVVAESPRLRLRRARLLVHGCVGTIERRAGTDEYRFRMRTPPPRPHAVLDARYTGALPDLFRPGSEIIAKGTLDAAGRLDIVADGIMARCPSKYDPGIPPSSLCPD